MQDIYRPNDHGAEANNYGRGVPLTEMGRAREVGRGPMKGVLPGAGAWNGRSRGRFVYPPVTFSSRKSGCCRRRNSIATSPDRIRPGRSAVRRVGRSTGGHPGLSHHPSSALADEAGAAEPGGVVAPEPPLSCNRIALGPSAHELPLRSSRSASGNRLRQQDCQDCHHERLHDVPSLFCLLPWK
jgi:hypothetical protein